MISIVWKSIEMRGERNVMAWDPSKKVLSFIEWI
jgi:hypothetical protein